MMRHQHQVMTIAIASALALAVLTGCQQRAGHSLQVGGLDVPILALTPSHADQLTSEDGRVNAERIRRLALTQEERAKLE